MSRHDCQIIDYRGLPYGRPAVLFFSTQRDLKFVLSSVDSLGFVIKLIRQ